MDRRRFVASAGASLACAGATPRIASAQTPSAGRFPVNGGMLGYRRFGDAGPAYVLLSGGPGMEAWFVDPIAIELSRERSIVVLDQRGTGTSRDAIGDGNALTIAGAVADLDALRSALSQKRLALLGHSWGSMLSMAYAAAHGDRVASLALLDPGGPDPTFQKGFGDRIDARLSAADNAAADAAQKAGQGTLRALIPGFFHDHAKGVAYAATLPAVYLHGDVNRALFSDVRAHYDVKAALRNTVISTLLVFGSDDPSRAAEAQLDGLFPRATKVIVPDAGHFPWIENPQPFYAAIRAFLDTVPPPA